MKRICPGNAGFSAITLTAVVLMCVAFTPLGQAAERLPAASDVIQRMIQRAQTIVRNDQGPHYTYGKRSLIEELDAHGKPLRSTERLYQVVLVAGFPFNRLVKVQGRELNAEELKKEQEREERFQQKFTAMDAKKMAARKEAWVTFQLMDRYQFQVRERVIFNNRPTLVLTFKPREEKLPTKTIRDKVLNRLAGTVWVDEEEAETAKLSVNLTETLSLGWFGVLGSLSKCDVSLERQRMPESVWVNAKQALLIHYRKLTATKFFRTTEESSDFKKAETKP